MEHAHSRHFWQRRLLPFLILIASLVLSSGLAPGRSIAQAATNSGSGRETHTLTPSFKPGTPTPSPRPGSPTPTPSAPPSTSGNGIWISREEVARLPMSGPSWEQLKHTADGDLGQANIADQDSNHDVNTLAVALVYARTGNMAYRAKAAEAIVSAIGTEWGGRTLALGRNLPGYVIAADLIDLRSYDAARDQQFRNWLSLVRRQSMGGGTLISTHEGRPNNWGTHAGAARIAADLYLGDTNDLARAALVFKGWLGDRSAYAGFKYGDLSWQADPKAPVGINGVGATRSGYSIDGALPDDMRRGCSFQWLPCSTNYPWGALEGATVQAQLLSRAGYDAWHWQNNAMFRALQFLNNLNRLSSGWWAKGDDQSTVWVVNYAYGANFPAAMLAHIGKTIGWTDWTFGK
jgi:hypothetical protein